MPPRPNRRQTFGLGLGAGLVATAAAAEDIGTEPPTFTLLLVNDIYLMDEVDGRGGFARLNAVVKAERAHGTPLLYCHAGDCFSPSLMSGLDHGAHIVELLNLAPPDVFVPGNHEFDFGPKVFAERIAQARFPSYAANLRDADGKLLPGVEDSAVFTLGGIKVGVVGIALEATPQKSQSGDLRFGPEIETLAASAKRLRQQGADLVVGVAHIARPADEAVVRAGIVDILLSGHDHDLAIEYAGTGRTAFAESSHDAHYVTAIDVRVRIDGEGASRRVSWRPSFRIHDTTTVTPDPDTLALVRRLEGQLSKDLDVTIGRTEAPLDSRIASVRLKEASFGDLVADAVRSATGAEIGLMNGGGIRGNTLYPAGTELTRRTVLTELPFGNTTVMVEIAGSVLREALENGYRELGKPWGGFLQISGMSVVLDANASPGKRIVSATIGGAALDDGKRYTVAANNFMLAGGNDYGMLENGRILVGATDGTLLANAVIAYIRAHAPLTIDPGQRIRIVP